MSLGQMIIAIVALCAVVGGAVGGAYAAGAFDSGGDSPTAQPTGAPTAAPTLELAIAELSVDVELGELNINENDDAAKADWVEVLTETLRRTLGYSADEATIEGRLVAVQVRRMLESVQRRLATEWTFESTITINYSAAVESDNANINLDEDADPVAAMTTLADDLEDLIEDAVASDDENTSFVAIMKDELDEAVAEAVAEGETFAGMDEVADVATTISAIEDDIETTIDTTVVEPTAAPTPAVTAPPAAPEQRALKIPRGANLFSEGESSRRRSLRSRRLSDFANEPAVEELFVPHDLDQPMAFPDQVLCYITTSFGANGGETSLNATALNQGSFISLVDDGVCGTGSPTNTTWAKFIWTHSRPEPDFYEWNGGLFLQMGEGQPYGANATYNIHFSVNATDEADMRIEMYYTSTRGYQYQNNICERPVDYIRPVGDTCNSLKGSFDASASGLPTFREFVFEERNNFTTVYSFEEGDLVKFKKNIMKAKKAADGTAVTSMQQLILKDDECGIDQTAFENNGGTCDDICDVVGTDPEDDVFLLSGILIKGNDMLSMQYVNGNISQLPAAQGDSTPTACYSTSDANSMEYVDDLRAFDAATDEALSFSGHVNCQICNPYMDCSAYTAALDRNGLDLSADADLPITHFSVYFNEDGYGYLGYSTWNDTSGESGDFTDINGDGERDGYYSKYNPVDGAVLNCHADYSHNAPAQIKVKAVDVVRVGASADVASCPALPQVPIEANDFVYSDTDSCSTAVEPNVNIPASALSANLATPPAHLLDPSGYSCIDGVPVGSEFTFYN